MRLGSYVVTGPRALACSLGALCFTAALLLCITATGTFRWQVTAVLGAVAISGFLAESSTRNPPGSDRPWNVHAVWLVPAVVLTDPVQFSGLLALSLIATARRSAYPWRLRVLAAAGTVGGTLVLYLVTLLTPGWSVALLTAIPLLMAVTVLSAALGPPISLPSRSVNGVARRHWVALKICSLLSGCLITAAVVGQPAAGLAGIAPMALAVYALRWPELINQARTDGKTGLPNAGRWEELTRRALTRCARIHRPAALLIIDIDHFKSVNDTYGHLAGDRILATVATVIRGALGDEDLVGRFGGEEFVVTAVGRSDSGAWGLAEQIRTAIAATRHEVVTRDSIAVFADPVTATIGIASSQLTGYGHTTMLRRADSALAAGKAAGRNQVRAAVASVGDEPSATEVPPPGGVPSVGGKAVAPPRFGMPARGLRSVVPPQRAGVRVVYQPAPWGQDP